MTAVLTQPPRADTITVAFQRGWLVRIVGTWVGQNANLPSSRHVGNVPHADRLASCLDEVAYVDRGHVPQWACSAREERVCRPLRPLPELPRPHRRAESGCLGGRLVDGAGSSAPSSAAGRFRRSARTAYWRYACCIDTADAQRARPSAARRSQSGDREG
jgi:hypothetical protein